MTVSARQFGITVVKSSGGEELVLCPFHADNSPSAWWNPSTQLFYCAVCSLGLNASQLASKLSIEWEEVQDESTEPDDYDLVGVNQLYELGDQRYHKYFEDREITQHVIDHYGVRWKSTYPEAAVLPITDTKGQVTGVSYRYLHPGETGTRYRVFGKVQPVWPMHLLESIGHQPIIVTEGAWSAMRLNSWFKLTFGYINPVFSLLGAKANRSIVDTLRPFDTFFLYDNDRAGIKACRRMRQLWPLAHAHTLSASPDDMTDYELEVLVNRMNLKVMP